MKRVADSVSCAPKKFKPWLDGLKATIADPKSHLFSDSQVVIIKDKFPKAKHHFLVLPKEDISSIKVLTDDHIDLLEHMQDVALNFINEHKDSSFKLGYHAQPSMTRLHLHVISDDMVSECLKTKKHWNSFNSEFFINSDDLIEEIKKHKKFIGLPSKKCKDLLDSPLKCHKCDYLSKNMPELKRHILKHINNGNC